LIHKLSLKARIVATVLGVALFGGVGGAAYAATSSTTAGFQQIACVQFGAPNSAKGNVMLYDYNDAKCPAGTYQVDLANPNPAPKPTPTVTVTVTPSPSTSTSSPAS
jgi:hypothetical protein